MVRLLFRVMMRVKMRVRDGLGGRAGRQGWEAGMGGRAGRQGWDETVCIRKYRFFHPNYKLRP